MEPRTMLFDLSGMLEYSKSGQFEETAQLEIDAPNFTTIKESSALSQSFVKALFANRAMMTGEEPTIAANQDVELDAGAIRLLLLASDVDFASVVDTFIALCSKSCTLDQERKVRIKKDHFLKMAYDDVLSFVCSYIATFIAPSVLSGLQNTGGKR